MSGLEEAEAGKIVPKQGDVVVGNFPDGLPFFACTFFELVLAGVGVGSEMADVGEIKHAIGGIVVGEEGAEEEIPVKIGREVAEVGGGIDGGAAGVNRDARGVFGRESFEGARGGIEKTKGH